MARSLPHKGLVRPIQLRKIDNDGAKLLSLLFGWDAWGRRPILSEFILILIALGAVSVFASVFLDFRVSKYVSLLGL